MAAALDAEGLPVVSSLAGAVTRPRLPAGPVHVGGFGGATGLADWLRAHDVTAVVDASHPFAARISANAVRATREVGLPLLRLERPAWTPGAGDRWHEVPDVAAAAERLPGLGRSALVTTGRRNLDAFAALTGVRVLARCVDPPGVVAPHVTVLLDRGPYTLDGELDLLQRNGIEVLVTKNSGGAMTAARLEAARRLGLPVLMVRRPQPPPDARPPAVVCEVADALAWARERLAGG
nr:cobalt-precorrin-6A reductase [Angustibacter aerolatus]